MKTTALIVSLVVCASCVLSKAEEMYSTKFDDTDLDAILESKRLRDGYVNCFMDRGSCTPAGDEVKKHLLDALETECRKCSEKQKENAKKVFKYWYKNDPETLKMLMTKYDPEGKYQQRLKDYIKSKGEIDQF